MRINDRIQPPVPLGAPRPLVRVEIPEEDRELDEAIHQWLVSLLDKPATPGEGQGT